MAALVKAKEPFRFFTRWQISELTGLRATTLSQMLGLIKTVPDSCIYHHTHRFLLQHQYLSPEPPNDFAYWVSEVLVEDELGEQLLSIDTISYVTLDSLRNKIAMTIEDYLRSNPLAKLKFARSGEEFHFIKSVSFILPAPYIACDLSEFAEALKKVTLDSIYFHIFEARMRLNRRTNDFSDWIELSVGNKDLAEEISHLDPYTSTLEDLRKNLIRIVEKRIAE